MTPRRLPLVLLVLLVVLGVLGGGGISYLGVSPVSAGSSSVPVEEQRLDRNVQLPHVPVGEPLNVQLGLSESGSAQTRNGESFSVEGPNNSTGFIQVRRADNGELVGLQYAPRIPGMIYPANPIDEKANAVAILYSLPGMPLTLSFADALLVELANDSRRMPLVIDAMNAQWAEGSNPLVSPNENTLTEAYELLAEVDRSLTTVVKSLGIDQLALSEGRSSLQPEDLITRSAVWRAPGSSGSATRFIVDVQEPASVPDDMEPACELPTRSPVCGLDEVYVNSRQGTLNANDRAALLCLTPNPGFLIDVDGLEGDEACLAVVSRADDDSYLNMVGVNFAPRWLFLYDSMNKSVIPDAVIEPKLWQLPSVAELAVILAEANFVAVDQAVESLCEFFGIQQCEVGPREDVITYMKEVVDSFATNGAAAFSLGFDPGADMAFEVIGLDFVDNYDRNTNYRAATGDDTEFTLMDARVAISSLATIADVIIVPSVKLWLDIRKFRVGDSGVDGRPSQEEMEKRKRTTEYRQTAIRLVGPILWAELRGLSVSCTNTGIDCLASSELRDSLIRIVEALIPAFAGAVAGLEVARLFESRTIGSDRGLSELRRSTSQSLVNEQALVTALSTSEAKEAATWGLSVLLNPESVVEGTDDVPAFLASEVRDGLLQGINVALAATPPGRIAKAIELGAQAAGLVANVGELAVDGQRFDQVEAYRVSRSNITRIPTESEAASQESLQGGPLDLTIVIDTSGSMEGDRLESVVNSVSILLELLRFQHRVSGEEITVSVMEFNSQPSWIFQRTPIESVSPLWKPSLVADDGTSIEPALRTAIAELKGLNSGNRRIILLTDGEDTDRSPDEAIPNMLVGRSSDGAGADTAAEVVVSGIRIDTIAYSFQEEDSTDLLRTIAAISRGRMYNATQDIDLVGAFVKTRQVSRGRLIRETGGLFSADGKAMQRVEVKPGRNGELPKRLVVSAYSPGGKVRIFAKAPDGLSPRSQDLTFLEGNMAQLVIRDPLPGVWEVTLQSIPGMSNALAPTDWGGISTLAAASSPVAVWHQFVERLVNRPHAVALPSDKAPANAYYLLVTEEGETDSIPVVQASTERYALAEQAALIYLAGWMILSLALSLVVAVRLRRRASDEPT